MDDINDKTLRLYTRLNSLKQNLPVKTTIVNEKYVREYHLIIDGLEKVTNSDLSEFKVADEEVKHQFSNYNLSGKAYYTKERFCDRSFLLAKLDALLGYFQIKYLSEEKRTIGFKK